ncbi:unnamed protein product [Rhodiola kirilowii]
MKAFLKSQDESVWDAVKQGWTHPVTIDEGGRCAPLAKTRWTEGKQNAEAANSKAMNAIFSAVDGKNFKMISTCEIAKTAWDILQTDLEADFNTRVLDISNESFVLGEPMNEEKLVRKVLRSLPKRYAMKALAVKEAQDVTTMRLNELMGSLQTYEMEMNEDDQLTKVKSVDMRSEITDV